VRVRLAAIVESAEDAIISVTLDGSITSWNAGAERLLGHSADEVLGKSIELIVPSERPEEEPQLLARIARGESVEHYETVRVHKSGRRLDVLLSLSPLRDSAGTVIGCAGIMHDISARRRLQKEVLEIAAREQRRIGHELHDSAGQELTALSLLAEALVKKIGDRDPAEAMIARKLAAGLQRTLGQIRGIARGLMPVEVDSQGLSAALEDLAARIGETTETTCTFRCGRMPVEVNDNQTATQLFHIAQEAVTNALRHGRASDISLDLAEDERKITLAIEDNGGGFAPASSEGEGMGLKIMHYRAGLIKARLTVGPAHPVGTAVTCTLSKGNAHEEELA
jgi:two-component system, LuxR family, sensor kinase FixL